MTMIYKPPKPLELWRKREDLGEFVASYIMGGELKIVDPNEARPVGNAYQTTDVAYFCLYVTRDGTQCSLNWYLRSYKKLIKFFEKIGEVTITSNDGGKWKDLQIISRNTETNIISLEEWYDWCEAHGKLVHREDGNSE